MADLRWGVEQRLEFIEFRLLWEGGINRSDIIERFGVSVPQASKDLAQYQTLAPDNIAYDKSKKRYLVAEGFCPQFLRPDAAHYLSQLQTVASGMLDQNETWLGRPPPFEAVPLPNRRVDTVNLQALLKALRKQKALEIRYQSLSSKRPKPIWRWISPHTFVFDGFRWHVRAFCHIDLVFKDFLLSRILQSRDMAPAKASGTDDVIWHELVTVGIKPHPDLTEDQKRFVAKDFGMKGQRLNVTVRLALLYYLLRRLGLLDAHGESRPAREQHVVLIDQNRIETALKRAQTGSATMTTAASPADIADAMETQCG